MDPWRRPDSRFRPDGLTMEPRSLPQAPNSVELSLDIEANRAARKYSRGELARRVAWIVGQLVFRLTPRTLFGLRRGILRAFGARIGANVNIYSTATIYMPWHLEVSDWAAIGEHAYIYNLGKITIEDHVTISQRAHLCAGTHDYTRRDMPLLKPPIRVGRYAWICADAFVGPDVTIGEGAVVGARAVVTHDVEPWAVVAGNPARTIKRRVINNS